MKVKVKEIKPKKAILNFEDTSPYFVNALRKLGKKLLIFYIHSYQSYLFNEFVVNYIKKNFKNYSKVKYSLGDLIFLKNKQMPENLEMPLINFDTNFKDEIYKKILEKQEITQKDFIIRQLPELMSTSQNRDLFVEIKWNYLKFAKKTANLSFFLPKGSYATIVIKKLFS
jgi:tRNA pseudouridine13 synthase